MPPPDSCANCGADIPRKALACPECGADERTGWRETSIYDGLDLPDEDEKPGAARRPVKILWLMVAAGLLILLVLGTLGLRL